MSQQEMSFARALTEARQIIVQQSNRIKADLEKIKSLQEQVATLHGEVGEHERTAREHADRLTELDEKTQALTANLNEQTLAREQAEGVIDRQGQRMTQLQETTARLETELAQREEQIARLEQDLDATRGQLPTAEDEEALAALTSLLVTKKVSVPAATIAKAA